jgi:hypothetical protein
MVWLAAGCASRGPNFERIAGPPDDAAVIYIFREDKLAGSALPMGVAVNGAPIDALWAGEYTVTRVRPGTAVVRAWQVGTLEGMIYHDAVYKYFYWSGVFGPPNAPLPIEVVAGREYFVEVQLGYRIKHHAAVDGAPKELASATRSYGPSPWESRIAAESARACNAGPRDKVVACLDALRKRP